MVLGKGGLEAGISYRMMGMGADLVFKIPFSVRS
jgi:hypothetical protein